MAHVMPRIAAFTQEFVAFIKRGQRIGAVRDDFSAETLVALMQGVKQALARTTLPRRSITRAELDRFNEVLWELLLRMVKP
jgi:hypothetical protein